LNGKPLFLGDDMTIVTAIEQEMKFVSDSEEGSKQYRKGYVRALEVVAEFFRIATNVNRQTTPKDPAVLRLVELAHTDNGCFASAPCTAQTDGLAMMGARTTFDGGELTTQEAGTLRLALVVLRSSNVDYSDFLNFWLSDYGAKILSPKPPPGLLPDSFYDDQMIVDATTYIH
jgi:hypothetical protein